MGVAGGFPCSHSCGPLCYTGHCHVGSCMTQLLQLLLCGFVFRAALHVWFKSAHRWGAWFPVLRIAMQWGLGLGLLAAGGGALYLLNDVWGQTDVLVQSVMALALGIGIPEVYYMVRGKAAGTNDETQRGSEVLSAKDVARKVKASKTKTDLSLGGVPLPVDAEPYHFLIAGSTGTGKSVALGGLLTRLRERGDTVILVDSGGDFLARHFRADTDFVFNPYDERCVGWSPVLEMQGAWDAQALARSIVPDGVGETREWNSYAQTFISSVLRRLWETKRLSMADFLYVVQVAPIAELKELLEGTPSASQLASEKMFGSIRSIASNYLVSYDYLPHDKQGFSVTEMIQQQHAGTLFVTYRDDQLDSLRNIIACLLDVASRAVLSLTPDPSRRVWLIIDEFASIGRVQSVEAVATKARKAGGCLVLGIQSVSQLRDRYGDNGAQTILSCLSTWLVLRCSDADTAEYMSRYIGEAEVLRTQQGNSVSDVGDTRTSSEQRLTKRVVLASEVQQFPNLTGMLKVAGGLPVCAIKLELPPKSKTSGAVAFQGRDFNARPLLRLAPKTPVAAPGAGSLERSEPATPLSGVPAKVAPVAAPLVVPPAKPAAGPRRVLPKNFALPVAPPAPDVRKPIEMSPQLKALMRTPDPSPTVPAQVQQPAAPSPAPVVEPPPRPSGPAPQPARQTPGPASKRKPRKNGLGKSDLGDLLR